MINENNQLCTAVKNDFKDENNLLLCWVSTLIMWNRIRRCLILFRLRTIDLTLTELWLCCRVFSTVVAVSLHAWLKIVFKRGPCRFGYYDDKTETEKQCNKYTVDSRYIVVQYNMIFHTMRHKQRKNIGFTKDTAYLAVTGELWCVHYEYRGKWDRDIWGVHCNYKCSVSPCHCRLLQAKDSSSACNSKCNILVVVHV